VRKLRHKDNRPVVGGNGHGDGETVASTCVSVSPPSIPHAAPTVKPEPGTPEYEAFWQARRRMLLRQAAEYTAAYEAHRLAEFYRTLSQARHLRQEIVAADERTLAQLADLELVGEGSGD